MLDEMIGDDGPPQVVNHMELVYTDGGQVLKIDVVSRLGDTQAVDSALPGSKWQVLWILIKHD